MDYHIRPATSADYDGLCAVLDEVDAMHREAMPRVFRNPEGPARAREYIDGLLADENVGLFVAEVGGRVVGMVHVLVREAPPIPIMVPRRFAVVDTLAVAGECRRAGIGRALMAEAERWAITHGAQDIELQVYEFNQGAQGLYRAIGYDTLTRRMAKPLR